MTSAPEGGKVAYLSALSGLQKHWLTPSLHFLEGASVRLGRSPTADDDGRANDVVVDADSVSRFHAVLERTGDAWFCRDDGSSGGTFVNDERLSITPRLLRPDDVLRLGPQVRLLCGAEETSHAQLARELPSPIARLEAAAPTTSARAQVQIQALFVAMERALRFVAACELAWLRQRAMGDAKLTGELARVLSARELTGASEQPKKLTMGTWRTLSTRLASLLPTDPAAPAVVRAARAMLRQTQDLANAVELRNVLSHADVPSESELTVAMPALRALAEKLIVSLSPLVQTRLVSVVESENLVRGYRYGAYVFTGDGRARLESWKVDEKLLPRWCYLVDAQGSEPLLLAPVVAATIAGDTAEITVAPSLTLGGEGAEVDLGGATEKLRLPVPWCDDVAALHDAVLAARTRPP